MRKSKVSKTSRNGKRKCHMHFWCGSTLKDKIDKTWRHSGHRSLNAWGIDLFRKSVDAQRIYHAMTKDNKI